MFTGIITDIGHVQTLMRGGKPIEAASPGQGESDTRIILETSYDPKSIDLGASIACAGVCLTVVDKGAADKDQAGGWFAVDVSDETLRCTNLGDWRPGTPVNLERSLRVGDEMGGHIVSGHVDGVGVILEIIERAGSREFVIGLPDDLAPYVARKGSLAINGTSLTVNAVGDLPDATASVNLIPHSLEETTFGKAVQGDRVNLEIDLLARYLARLMEQRA
ncbi:MULTISPECIES: riboflavin synthase [unclassified Iodidimonas]|jgi:riboflavin synthase|uniref:riboflavin synthase n=1 Tax=unclassified Iodidimonas TaxID=2626145 RepID=UPI002483280F|nr:MULTISPECIES: riboflavin synthase [unclassified Iodidimonas]